MRPRRRRRLCGHRLDVVRATQGPTWPGRGLKRGPRPARLADDRLSSPQAAPPLAVCPDSIRRPAQRAPVRSSRPGSPESRARLAARGCAEGRLPPPPGSSRRRAGLVARLLRLGCLKDDPPPGAVDRRARWSRCRSSFVLLALPRIPRRDPAVTPPCHHVSKHAGTARHTAAALLNFEPARESRMNSPTGAYHPAQGCGVWLRAWTGQRLGSRFPVGGRELYPS